MNGKGTKPISSAKGKYGREIVRIKPIMLKINKELVGLFLKSFCVFV